MKTLFCTLAVTLVLATPNLANWARGDQESTQPAALPATHDVAPEAAPETVPDLARIFGARAAQDTQDESDAVLVAKRLEQELAHALAEQRERQDERTDREQEWLQALTEREVRMAEELAKREAELHTLQQDLESRLHKERAAHDLEQTELQAILARELANQQRELTLEQAQIEAGMMRELAEREAQMTRERSELEHEFHMQLAERESELHRELAERDAERAELEMLLRREMGDAHQDEGEQEARQLRRELERLKSRLEAQAKRLERARDRERELQGSWRESRGRRETRPERSRPDRSDRPDRPARPDRPTRPETLEGYTEVIGIGGGTKDTYVGSLSPKVLRGQVGVAPTRWTPYTSLGTGGKAAAPRAQDGASGGITIIVEEGDVYIQGGGKGINVAPQAGGGIWSVTAPSTGKSTYTRVPAPSASESPKWGPVFWSTWYYGADGQDKEKAKSKAKSKAKAKAKAEGKSKKKDKDLKGSVSGVWATAENAVGEWVTTGNVGGEWVKAEGVGGEWVKAEGAVGEWVMAGTSPYTVWTTPVEVPEFEIEAFQTPEFEVFEAPEIEGFQVLELGTFGVPVLDIEAFEVPQGKTETFTFDLQLPGYTQIESVPFEAVSFLPVRYLPLGATAPANSDLLSEILDLVRELKTDMSALREEVQDLHSEVARSPRRGTRGGR